MHQLKQQRQHHSSLFVAQPERQIMAVGCHQNYNHSIPFPVVVVAGCCFHQIPYVLKVTKQDSQRKTVASIYTFLMTH